MSGAVDGGGKGQKSIRNFSMFFLIYDFRAVSKAHTIHVNSTYRWESLS